MLRQSYFPHLFKIAKIIMILKPGKKPTKAASYRPIAYYPCYRKCLKQIYIKYLKVIIDNKKNIPAHQFGFRNKHGTINEDLKKEEIAQRCFYTYLMRSINPGTKACTEN